MPVTFQNMPQDLPAQDLPMVFYQVYKTCRLENKFKEPIPTKAHQILDKHLFNDWTKISNTFEARIWPHE